MNKRVWDGSNPIPFLILFIYNIMTELSKLAEKYLTDKGNTYYNSHGYTEIYDSYFQKLKNENRKIYILEIGVQCGYDLLLLNDYFEGNCEIYGIDIDIKQCKIDIPENIHILEMNGSNINELQKWYNNSIKYSVSQLPMFDIIIDDGSHTSSDIFNSLKFFYNKLSENGLYIIEDLHCAYSEEALNYLALGGFNNTNIKDNELKIIQQHMAICNMHYIYNNYNIHFKCSICCIIQFK